jgi:hypothetical protein
MRRSRGDENRSKAEIAGGKRRQTNGGWRVTREPGGICFAFHRPRGRESESERDSGEAVVTSDEGRVASESAGKRKNGLH